MKILFLCALVGMVAAQRGSYGGSRPITGSRYETADNSNSAAPAQSNFVQPSQGNQGSVGQNPDNRFSQGNNAPVYQQQQPYYQQQQPGGFGGFGSGFGNNQGFQPFPFNGR
jgi:hypothetical protein